MTRFEFFGSEINFENINSLIKGKFQKKMELMIKTSKDCNIVNCLEIQDKDAYLTINTCDLEDAINNVSFFKLSKLCIILENNIEIEQYIKKFKKIKGKVTIAINDIAYFNVEEANSFYNCLNVEYIHVLESPKHLKLSDHKQCYIIEDYVKMRKCFDEIQKSAESNSTNELEKFNYVYQYFKNNIKYVLDETDLKDVFMEKKASHNYYALAMNSCLKALNFESKVIKGNISEEKNCLWNQVKLNGNWYNFDVAYDLSEKGSKKILQYLLKGNILNDEQFSKSHIVDLTSKPEVCTVELHEMKKAIKRELKEIKKEQKVNRISIWKRLTQKMISMFKFNKSKALPEPENTKEEKK